MLGPTRLQASQEVVTMQALSAVLHHDVRGVWSNDYWPVSGLPLYSAGLAVLCHKQLLQHCTELTL